MITTPCASTTQGRNQLALFVVRAACLRARFREGLPQNRDRKGAARAAYFPYLLMKFVSNFPA